MALRRTGRSFTQLIEGFLQLIARPIPENAYKIFGLALLAADQTENDTGDRIMIASSFCETRP